MPQFELALRFRSPEYKNTRRQAHLKLGQAARQLLMEQRLPRGCRAPSALLTIAFHGCAVSAGREGLHL